MNLLLERSAFRTQRTAIDRMIGIAFNVHDLRRNILCTIPDRVNDDAATDGTIRTRAAGFSRAIDLQTLRLCINRRKIEAECS